MTNITYHNSGQTIMEIALGISLAIILVVGAISSWNWLNKTMVERFETYNSSRLAAIHDIRGDQFGMNATYDKPNLNIFSLDTSINNAPIGTPVIPLADNYPLCYDSLNASLAIVNQTRTEIQALDQEIAGITRDIIALKTGLGNDVEVLRNCPMQPPDTKKFNVWIYGEDHMQDFFDNNFTTVGGQLVIKLGEEGMSGCGISFWTPSWPGTPVNVVNEYINPGIGLEAAGAQKAGERNTKQQSADSLQEQAWGDFYTCIQQPPQQDACYEQCKHFQQDSERLGREALAAQASGNFGLAKSLSDQAEQARNDFDACYHDCKMLDPCYADCYNRFEAEAEQAAEDGRIEDYSNLHGQFLDCLKGC